MQTSPYHVLRGADIAYLVTGLLIHTLQSHHEKTTAPVQARQHYLNAWFRLIAAGPSWTWFRARTLQGARREGEAHNSGLVLALDLSVALYLVQDGRLDSPAMVSSVIDGHAVAAEGASWAVFQ